MDLDRAGVIHLIRDIRDNTLAEPPAARRSDARRAHIIEEACARRAVSVDRFHAALASPELGGLFRLTMDEIAIGAPDPGPYDAISRESARGVPEADDGAFERDDRLLYGREFR